MALQHKPLILKNYMVNTLIELLGIPLQANVARSRNRFIMLFNETATHIESERQRLLQEYGVKDETTGDLKVGTDGHYEMTDKEAFTKAFEELTQRTLAVPCTGEQYVDFSRVRNILETLETRLTVAQTTIYDEIMNCFDDWAGIEREQSEAEEEGEDEGTPA